MFPREYGVNPRSYEVANQGRRWNKHGVELPRRAPKVEMVRINRGEVLRALFDYRNRLGEDDYPRRRYLGKVITSIRATSRIPREFYESIRVITGLQTQRENKSKNYDNDSPF